MKTHVDKETFVNAFDRFGRSEQFSRAAREALFEYYEQLEEDLGEEIEFDCIAICCDWSEYEDIFAWADDYFCNYREEFGIEYDNPMTGETEDQSVTDCDGYYHNAVLDAMHDYLRDNTQVIEFEGGILVQAF